MKKLCECGCGRPAPIASRNRPYLGHVKGQQCRFIAGHQCRLGIARTHGQAHPRTKLYIRYANAKGRGKIERDVTFEQFLKQEKTSCPTVA
jgi:hypothetical protein